MLVGVAVPDMCSLEGVVTPSAVSYRDLSLRRLLDLDFLRDFSFLDPLGAGYKSTTKKKETNLPIVNYKNPVFLIPTQVKSMFPLKNYSPHKDNWIYAFVNRRLHVPTLSTPLLSGAGVTTGAGGDRRSNELSATSTADFLLDCNIDITD